MLPPGSGNHLRTNIHADAIRGLERFEQKAGLAANVQYALSRLDEVFQEPLEDLIIIAIPSNPIGPRGSLHCLQTPRALIPFAKCLQTPYRGGSGDSSVPGFSLAHVRLGAHKGGAKR
jgi:hypothetical protein